MPLPPEAQPAAERVAPSPRTQGGAPPRTELRVDVMCDGALRLAGVWIDEHQLAASARATLAGNSDLQVIVADERGAKLGHPGGVRGRPSGSRARRRSSPPPSARPRRRRGRRDRGARREAVPALGFVRTVDPVAVPLPGADAGHVDVPDERRAVRHRDPRLRPPGSPRRRRLTSASASAAARTPASFGAASFMPPSSGPGGSGREGDQLRHPTSLSGIATHPQPST